MDSFTYKDAGVDIEVASRAVEKIRADVQSTYTPAVIGDIGGFGGLFSGAELKNMHDPVLVSATDGVGTKLALAKRLGDCSTVGIDLVAMCVNDIVATGAKPLFFLDYLAVGRLDDDFAALVVGGVAEGCRQAGCALIGGEMAEHPGVMKDDDFDLAGFAVGVVERGNIMSPTRVQNGDKIIGLASSGLHSNGYSLVRKAWTDPLDDRELLEATLSDGSSLAKALIQPTRIYVKSLLEAVAASTPGSVRAAAHITGGGITENLNRALPPGLDAQIDLSAWPVPEIISRACSVAALSQSEALKTFNMGIGMALIVAPEACSQLLEALSQSQQPYLIGTVAAASTPSQAGQVLYMN
ncbi:MAG: phosphoribosylformylglycinamidine cyclo-ligase [Coriobacteriia bacterium]|nr:phosphoribosylformylglycinamidine cyclo-ligase [Coriobacteriia bacterium]